MTSPRADERAVLLFDGVCVLCSGSVDFVIARDPAGRVAFAPLQSDVARKMLEGADLDPANLDTVVLVEGDRIATRSDAALRLLGYLRFPWPLLRVLRLAPRVLRDAAYGFVARRRYRWFGKLPVCRVPSPEIRARFLED